MGAMQRNKGKAGELEIVHLLRAHGWDRAERTHDGRAQLARGDIRRGPEGVHIEVRRRETIKIWACLEDAEREADDHQLPVLAFRRNRSGWYAALPLEELLELLRLREAA
jgi:Holliday junction resolvase